MKKRTGIKMETKEYIIKKGYDKYLNWNNNKKLESWPLWAVCKKCQMSLMLIARAN